MRQRDEHQTSQAHEQHTDTAVSNENAVGTLTQLMVTQQLLPGKHRAPAAAPRIPTQSQPTHDMAPSAAPAPAAPIEPEPETAPAAAVAPAPVAAPVVAPLAKVVRLPLPAAAPHENAVPEAARWKASHLPRTVAAATLAMAATGTAALGARYAQTRASDDFISLAIGLGVVVVLWAVVIASTPQVVSLDGSVLTVHNTGGSESFDLADGLQPVDVVGNARTSHWAILLHRPNGTTAVLRRNDVNAAELDPIVRHYRMVADQRHSDRDDRFNR